MILKRLSFVLLTSAVVDAFSSFQTPVTRRTSLSATSHGDANESSLPTAMRNMAVTSAVALALIMPPSAIAQDTPSVHLNDNAVYSSTVTLSDVIKTMDFSLPSSYDNIADPVASGVDELTTSTVKGSSKKVEKKKTEKKKSGAPSTNKGLSLPSFGGGGGDKPTINSDAFKPKTAEQKAADLAARRAEREEAANAAIREKAEAEKRAAAERDANIKAARLEKIAKREEEAAKKAAEESAKRDAMMKDVVVVDTSMPQY